MTTVTRGTTGPILLVLFLAAAATYAAGTPEGTAWVESHGYKGCILLENGDVRVVLDPNLGGRVIEYSLKGTNAIYMDPAQDGRMWQPGEPTFDPTGGRCDIGPEEIIAPHPELMLGKWTAAITGPRSARMTSVRHAVTGIQLVRDFRLDKTTSHLLFTQTIRNISGETKRYFHWGRTFAVGGGIFAMPLTPDSRFPQGYINYGPGPVINYRPPQHPNVTVRDGFFVVTGEPPLPQYGIDSFAGWMGYITRSNLLFVKRYPVYPDRPYGEIPAPPAIIWYNKEEMCEIEPIAPRETIRPGKSVSFTEDWWLFPYPYPPDRNVDLKALAAFVDKKAR